MGGEEPLDFRQNEAYQPGTQPPGLPVGWAPVVPQGNPSYHRCPGSWKSVCVYVYFLHIIDLHIYFLNAILALVVITL